MLSYRLLMQEASVFLDFGLIWWERVTLGLFHLIIAHFMALCSVSCYRLVYCYFLTESKQS